MDIEVEQDIDELAAMQHTLDGLFGLLDGLAASDWLRPTRCAPFDVGALVAHIAGSFAFVESWLIATPAGSPRLDRSTMWRAFPEETPGQVIEAAVATRSGKTPAELSQQLRTAVERFTRRAASLRPDQLAACPMFGHDFVLAASEVIANRVLEVGVHLLDIQAAVELPQQLPHAAGPVITSILDGLLGQPPPGRLGWDTIRYTLAGTGRADLTPTERKILGDRFAARFPLLH